MRVKHGMIFENLLIFVGWLILSGNLVQSKNWANGKPQNIVLIIADDLGWDDVSFHGSDQILTPNIDLLAYTGVALGRYYSHCVCTPSRAALLTGKYAYTLGMQGYPLTYSEDRGLPINEKILPQYLKERGYATHLVGKWHVGSSREEYLPTNRGFDSHYGHRGGFLDYYEYTAEETLSSGKVSGLCLFRNMTPDWDTAGYITDIYNREAKRIIKQHDTSSPLFLMVAHSAPHAANEGAILQAPPDVVRAMRHVESPKRRIFAAMVKKLDDSVGDIISSLNKKGILENTIIAFMSDNGGMTVGNSINYAVNWPLRGLKMSPFEGGVRVAGLVWSYKINVTSHLWNGYVHVIDWLPTLISAAGLEPPKNIDGKDYWKAIIENKEGREEMIEIDDYTGFASITSGEYKLIRGKPLPEYSVFYGNDLRGIIGHGPDYKEELKACKVYDVLQKVGKPFDLEYINLREQLKIKCNHTKEDLCFPGNDTICLFNIKNDPCETTDVSTSYPEVVSLLQLRLDCEMKRLVPRTKPFHRDPMSNPKLHNYTWTTWLPDHSSIKK